MICPLCTSNKFQEKKMKSCQVYQCSNCALQYFDDDKCDKDSNYLQNYKESRKDKSVLSKLRQIQYSIDVEHLKKNILKGNVLDVGCSTGEFLNKLQKVSKLNLYGIDTDESAISVAKNKYDSTIDFVNTDLINYQTNLKFDCIIFRGSFQFLGHDLKKTLEKISKISSNNCKIIIYSLPNSNSILYYLLKDEWNLFDMFSKTLIFNKTSIMKLCEIYNYFNV